MNNPLTKQIESRLGAIYAGSLALFFIGLIFIALKNFNSEIIILETDQTKIKTISNTERILIGNWVRTNNIELPEREGYRYLIFKYPNKPWIQ
ncbi:MAG: hypothetical protein COV30_01630 [Candidatus Yanofskybacteria bacterium CG10_big_fil_rev_8_21_14_0_10_37_15]|uniref:Uncharacterized protein n=1 Tax=Candidatus Yanofskybacteria bacterium CG10_big_fil_rev_8_21_14_0_10_37_15 TaxID=1975097 RepID=A0A2H0R5S3_9BACT|nr:MAG: hypothetical protein COV30_01630 [Candidatus Yanofskybacteria bacterium CG10_big_fil_rev_8_21_14_0_10_37_15]